MMTFRFDFDPPTLPSGPGFLSRIGEYVSQRWRGLGALVLGFAALGTGVYYRNEIASAGEDAMKKLEGIVAAALAPAPTPAPEATPTAAPADSAPAQIPTATPTPTTTSSLTPPPPESTDRIGLSSQTGGKAATEDLRTSGETSSGKPILLPPDGSRFDPSFADTRYKVVAPWKIAQTEGVEYLVFFPGSKGEGTRNGYDSLGVNITIDGAIVAHARTDLGGTVRITYTDNLRRALAEGKAGFQVMAFSGEKMVASYRNGVFERTTQSSIESALSDLGAGRASAYAAAGRQVREGQGLREQASRPLVERYLSSRSIDVCVGSQQGVEPDPDLETFNGMVVQAAAVYRDARSQGMDHYASLREVVENADMGAIRTSADAYEAVILAQRMGEKVVLGRWNAAMHDRAEVSSYIRGIYEARGADGKRMHATKDILAFVTEKFGAEMSETTMRRYLKPDRTAEKRI